MRIFKLVFGGLILVMVVGLGVWLGYEKVVMGVAAYKLQNDFNKLKLMQRGSASIQGCDLTTSEAMEQAGYQLRFTSDTTYELETTCGPMERPKTLTSKTLFGGVKRLYGAGVFLATATSDSSPVNGWVHLTYGKMVTAVGFFDNKTAIKWKAQTLDIGGDNVAQANCTDWGFFCCKTGAEKGTGAQVNTLDCPTSCYQQCEQLPVTIFFNSDPLLDAKSRVIVVRSPKTKVDFGFEIADYDGQVNGVTLDFGDGVKREGLQAKEQHIAHEYKCGAARCLYKATLTSMDNDGNSLVNTGLNQITVILEP